MVTLIPNNRNYANHGVAWDMTAPGGKTAPSCRQIETTPHIYRIYICRILVSNAARKEEELK